MNRIEGYTASKICSLRNGLGHIVSGIKAVYDGEAATKEYFLNVAERWDGNKRFRSNKEYEEYRRLIDSSKTRLAVWDTFLAPLAQTLVAYSIVSPALAVGVMTYNQSEISMLPFYYGVIAPYPGGVLTKSAYMMARDCLSMRHKLAGSNDSINPSCGIITTASVYGLAFISNFFPLGHTLIHPLLGFVENPELSFATVNILTRRLGKGNPNNSYAYDPIMVSAYGSELRRGV